MALLKCPNEVKPEFYVVNTTNLTTLVWVHNYTYGYMVLSIVDVTGKDGKIIFHLPKDVDTKDKYDVAKYMNMLVSHMAAVPSVSLITPPTKEYLTSLNYRD